MSKERETVIPFLRRRRSHRTPPFLLRTRPIGLEAIGRRCYILFCILLVVFPETKGHSPEEIAVLFGRPKATEGSLAGAADAADVDKEVAGVEV